MEIIKPSCELWIQENPIDHVARCARICYASDKTTGNTAMYNRLQNSNHMSMFRHESIYMIVPGRNDRYELIDSFESCPYVDYKIDYDNDEIYISTNRQFFIENESIRYFGEWIVESIIGLSYSESKPLTNSDSKYFKCAKKFSAFGSFSASILSISIFPRS